VRGGNSETGATSGKGGMIIQRTGVQCGGTGLYGGGGGKVAKRQVAKQSSKKKKNKKSWLVPPGRNNKPPRIKSEFVGGPIGGSKRSGETKNDRKYREEAEGKQKKC